jgi:hypothetical protein
MPRPSVHVPVVRVAHESGPAEPVLHDLDVGDGARMQRWDAWLAGGRAPERAILRPAGAGAVADVEVMRTRAAQPSRFSMTSTSATAPAPAGRRIARSGARPRLGALRRRGHAALGCVVGGRAGARASDPAPGWRGHRDVPMPRPSVHVPVVRVAHESGPAEPVLHDLDLAHARCRDRLLRPRNLAIFQRGRRFNWTAPEA